MYIFLFTKVIYLLPSLKVSDVSIYYIITTSNLVIV